MACLSFSCVREKRLSLTNYATRMEDSVVYGIDIELLELKDEFS